VKAANHTMHVKYDRMNDPAGAKDAAELAALEQFFKTMHNVSSRELAGRDYFALMS